MIMSLTSIERLIFGFCLFGAFALTIQKPQIVKHPINVITVAGKDVVLTCVVENLPVEDDLVQWTKDGFALGYDREIPGFKSYSMIGDESIGEYNLLIQNASLQDEGEYECQVRLDRMRTKATVTILVQPQGPIIEDAHEDVINVLAHDTNFITCRSWAGKPAGKLAWYKDGVIVEKNVTHAETRDTGKLQNSSATLRLWPTEDNEGDAYECVMTVDEKFREFGDSEFAETRTVRLNIQKPPVASLSIPFSELKEGENLFASCLLPESKPPATSFKWYIDGNVLQGKNEPTLEMFDVNKTLNGAVLGCSAANEVGQSKISTVVLNILYSPVLLLAPQDVVTNSSTVVNLSCAWDSNPPALITWYKRGNRDAIVGDSETLQLQVADQQASGIYVCVADARGVASKSVRARVDVLGPPIFSSPTVQRAVIGERAILDCFLESTPGISHITWSWNIGGTVTVLENNATSVDGKTGRTKYTGLVVQGGRTASLMIDDVTAKDMTQYNCTVYNPYGAGMTIISLEEQINAAMGTDVWVICTIAGGILFVIFILLLVVFCCCKRKQQKSTTFAPEKESLQVEFADGASREDNRVDLVHPNVKLTGQDPDSDNPSTSASVSSRDVARAQLEDLRNFAPNDDGYHTEEANSWNRNEKQSPPSSPTRSAREDYVREPYMMSASPAIGLERANSPYASSEVASDVGNPLGHLRYNLQPQQPYDQFPMQHGPNGVVDLPAVARVTSPLNMYGAPPSQYPPLYYQGPTSSSFGYRSGPGYATRPERPRAGSNAPSIVSSHRSVTPSQYLLGRATPTSVLGDHAMYSFPAQPHAHLASPQTAVEQDRYENLVQMNRLPSRMSQASRSSEMLNKPMTARMATHV